MKERERVRVKKRERKREREIERDKRWKDENNYVEKMYLFILSRFYFF